MIRDIAGLAGQDEVGGQRPQVLRRDARSDDLVAGAGALTAPPVVQAEEVLDGQKGQFDIPTPRVEPGDLAHGQLERVEHIGEVHAQLVTIAKAHQAHGPTGVGPCSEPSQTRASRITPC